MHKKNILFIRLFITGFVGVIIGAGLKIGGNPNFGIVLGTAMLMKLTALILLIWFNFGKIKAALS